ncbi:sensor histidine kinase [Paenibacillus roseipurpureus]|uniref:histidine kinase n=1 Tax=Paenibacillus roseopurpureus TaxID=2918901 RepID=A0AA96RNB4_9BACL|nr:sensor histidine kinase [Paenibacillus sp. MBLB1832]WNR45262.1 sensor histidine kinase [Paenibacillus sp. MBLB1832]
MRRLSLSFRLLLYFVIVIVVSLSVIGFFSYSTASRILDAQQEKQLSQIITSTAHQTELYMQSYERASNVLISQDEVKRFVDIQPTNSYEYVLYADLVKTNAIRTTFLHYPHMNSIYIIGANGRYVLDNNYVTGEFEIAEPGKLYEKLMSSIQDPTRLTILHTSIKPDKTGLVVTLVRPFRGYSTYDFNGLIAMEVNVNELSTLWEKVDIGDEGYFFIVDGDGNLIYHPDKSLMGKPLAQPVAEDIIAADEGSIRLGDSKDERLYVWRSSAYSGWKLVVSLPVNELRKPIMAIRSVIIPVGALTLIVGLWMAYQFSQSIHRPVQILKQGMRQTERGVWKHIPVGDRLDELGLLTKSYNLMVTRLSEMIEKVYHAELEQQKAELAFRTQQLERQRAEFQALQLQINPHFLYNTLETINCYAIIQDSDEIREIVGSMAYMLRYASQTNLKEITVVNELNHIRNYMIILKHRLDREFEIDVAIPPSLLLEKMVCFTLQPLIENVFEHGFRKKIAKHHFIRINAMLDEDDFIVTVEDNGLGMSMENLEELRVRLRANKLAFDQGPESFGEGGTGILNVHRRIQMVFGKSYGLVITSTEGEGTTITMKLPKENRDKYFI